MTAAVEQFKTLPRAVQLAVRGQLGPTFANDSQRAFFDSQAQEILYSGAMGAGKSRILCEKAWDIARHYPGVTVGLFRKVAASLPATTMRTFVRDVLDERYLDKVNRSENWFDLTNGSRIYFLGLDPNPLTGDPSKVGSLDLAWAGVDEAVECTENDWIMLQGRLRDPRIPWHQLAAATNPGPPTHWLKRRFTPGTDRLLYLHATAADNRFLPQDYKERIAGLPDNATGRRLGRGEWAMAEGAIWQLPEQSVKMPETLDFKTVVAGVDWGYVHAFACEVVGVSGSGRMAVVDEVYQREWTIDQIIPALQFVWRAHKVSKFYADPSEPAYIRQCQAAGIPMEPARNDVGPGIDAVATAIARGMTVAPNCTGLLGEIPGYTWSKDRRGELRDVPVEIGDDACDALRYAVIALDGRLNLDPWANLNSAGGVA